MTRITAAAVLFAASVGLVGLPARSLGRTYTFTKIADSAVDDLDPFSTGAPSHSDSGYVAFGALTADQSTSVVTRTGPGLSGPLNRVLDSSSDPDIGSFFRNVSVNNSGQVAAWSTYSANDASEAIFRSNGDAPELIIEVGNDRPLNFVSVVVSLNDAGTVTWQGELNDPDFPQGLFTGTGGGAFETLLNTAVDTDFDSSFAATMINNVGQIAFVAGEADGGDAVFRYDAGSYTPIVDSAGPFSAVFDDEVSINSAGRVLVIGTSDDISTEFLIVGDGTSPATAVVDTAGPLEGINAAALNDLGQFAFSALFDDFSTVGIFAGPELTEDRVIQTGDILDGSPVTFLSFYREGLNNSGQVAFFAQLADGRGVVMVASPSVPEPASVVLTLTGLGALLLFRLRGRARIFRIIDRSR